MKETLILMLVFLQVNPSYVLGQTLFEVEGNGLFTSPSSTMLDVKSIDDNANSLLRFGDLGVAKSALGFNGNEDHFKISMGSTLGRDDLTISQGGRLAIHSLSSDHRFLVRHNSTSGIEGSAQLCMSSSTEAGMSRLRFNNAMDDKYFEMEARAKEGSALLNMHFDDGSQDEDILSLDGDLFRVGILQTAPEGYLHIRQLSAGVDALAFENDATSGSDKWSMRVGDEDILIYYNGGIRGGFDATTGNYNNFPPMSSALRDNIAESSGALNLLLSIEPEFRAGVSTDQGVLNDQTDLRGVDEQLVFVYNEGEAMDVSGESIRIILASALEERTEIIDRQLVQINRLREKQKELMARIERAEAQLK